MIQITQRPDGRIQLRTPYELKDVCKALPGRRWDATAKAWHVPGTPAAAKAVLAALPADAMPPQWLFEMSLRGAHADGLRGQTDLPPIPRTKTSPWSNQLRGYHMIARQAATFLAWEMGTGKSAPVTHAVSNLDIQTTLILCPTSVVGVWPREFGRHTYTDDLHIVALRSGSVKKRTALAEQAAKWCARSGKKLILVLNYEAAWREPFASWSLGVPWDIVIADECVPAGTMISTPHGDMPIEEIKEGGKVYGMKNGHVVETVVTATFSGMTSATPLLQIGPTRMTEQHLVWTRNRGYISAKYLDLGLDTVAYIGSNIPIGDNNYVRTDMPMVRESISGGEETEQRQAAPILQSILLGMLADVTPRICQNSRDGKTTKGSAQEYATSPQEQGCDEEAGRLPAFAAKSVSRPSGSDEGPSGECGKRMAPFDGRQWEGADATAEDITRSARDRMGHRSSGRRAQGRHRQSEIEAGDRSGRAFSQDEDRASKRPAERKDIRGQRMENDSILESGNTGRSSSGLEAGQELFDIETGTSNFFANGLLVHNSHRCKAPGGKASKYLAKLGARADRRVCLTGTPMPHSPLDVYAQFRFLDSGIFGTSFTSFRAQYAVMGGYGGHEVKDFQNLDELHSKFYSIADRVEKTDVLDLPPFVHEERLITLSRESRRVYDDLESIMIADVEGGTVTVSNALARLIRLQQVTSGYTVIEGEPDHRGVPEKDIIPLDADKERALVSLLGDLPADQPVIVFAKFHYDLDAVHRAAEKAGRTSVELSGRRNEIGDTWLDGPDTVAAIQIQAGGVGIDLTRASVAVYYSMGFSGGDYEQSLARCHRHGQENKVTYIHLIAEGTVDRKVHIALKRKADVVRSVLEQLVETDARKNKKDST